MYSRAGPVEQWRVQRPEPVPVEIQIDDRDGDGDQYRAADAGHQAQEKPKPPGAVRNQLQALRELRGHRSSGCAPKESERCFRSFTIPIAVSRLPDMAYARAMLPAPDFCPTTPGLGANPGNQTAEPLRHSFRAREWAERVRTHGGATHRVVTDRQSPDRHASDRCPTEREAANGESTQG